MHGIGHQSRERKIIHFDDRNVHSLCERIGIELAIFFSTSIINLPQGLNEQHIQKKHTFLFEFEFEWKWDWKKGEREKKCCP